MKKQEKITELKKSIKEKGLQLEKLGTHVDNSDVCSDLYNKVVLEKAMLTKELEDLQNSGVLNSIKKLVPRKKTLICDYFHK